MTDRAPADASPPLAGRTRIVRTGWWILTLLFLVQMVNFFDKSVVSLAAGPMMRELNLSPQQYGLIASSFFSLYAVGGLAVAFLAAPRFRPRILVLAMLVLWSLLQLPIVLSASLMTLVACRTLLGAAEGGATPMGINACYEWFENDKRNLPTAILLAGSTVGSLTAAPILTYVIELFGWRMAFLFCAIAGGALALLWLLTSRDGPRSGFREDASRPAANTLPPLAVWRDRTLIGCFVAGSSCFWVLGFTVAWLPPMIETELGFSPVATGWILSGLYLFQAVLSLLIVWATDYRMRRGGSSRVYRGLASAVCLVGCALAFFAAAAASQADLRLALIALAMGLSIPPFTFLSALTAEVAPVPHSNQVQTLLLSLISLIAIFPPIVIGWLVQQYEAGWELALAANGVVCLLGGLLAFTLMHPGRSRLALGEAMIEGRS